MLVGFASYGQSNQLTQQPPKLTKRFKLGSLQFNYLLYFFIPLVIFACLFSYWVAVLTEQERPFPHTTITNMSRFYPQDLVFRLINLPAGGFTSLAYFVMFKWLKKVKEVAKYPHNTQQWLHPLAQISILGFYAAIATIDGGSLPFIHILGALLFFVVLFLISTIVSVVLLEIRSWCTSVLSRWSTFLKFGIAFYLAATVIYSISLVGNKDENEDPPPMVIAEWNLVIGGLIWLFTFSFQWRGVDLVLVGDVNQTLRRLDISQGQDQHLDQL